MFGTLGRIIARHPGRLAVVWLAAAAGASIWAFLAEPAPPYEMKAFLPADSPFSIAVDKLHEAFPDQAAVSSIFIIARRAGGLSPEDFDWLDRITRAAGGKTENRVLSPAVTFLRPRLVSRDGRAAISIVNLSGYMISPKAVKAVEDTEAVIRALPPPTGLEVELTGSAAIGRDYALASGRALHRSTWVTVIAVLVILVLVYRSPAGAMVPLAAIGLSVYLAMVVLAVLAKYAGWEVSSMEQLFVVVLLFGAGVDYALFWIARYREGLAGSRAVETAAVDATEHAGPAILFSALTTMIGMCALLAAELGVSRASGKVLLVALGMALLAGLTLAPAIARVLGRALFWPEGASARPTFVQRVVWPALAGRLVRSPKVVLAVGLLVLAAPAALALRMQPRFDSLSELPEGTSSKRGYDIAEAHFSKGQLYSSKLLFVFDRLPGSAKRLSEISGLLRERMMKVPGVEDVYSLDAPLGKNLAVAEKDARGGVLGSVAAALSGVIGQKAQPYYLSSAHPAMMMEILIDYPPFSLEAMRVIDEVSTIAHERVERWANAGIVAQAHFAGLTPYIMGVRDVAGRDQRRVMTLATVLIAIVVLMLVRDAALTAFMVFATLLTYGAALKFTELFFIHAMGLRGIDWKVRLIVFVVVVAVGQDYNIFLVSRLMEERRRWPLDEAVRRAVVSTGSVISSCGIIMAATLGSLWAGRLSLLRQVGFALALGILIDTYFVRPILIPSFFMAMHARRGGAKGA